MRSTTPPPSPEQAHGFLRQSDFVWHQRFELAPGVWTPGSSDTARLLKMAKVPLDLSGMTVLDVGTANGGCAFEAERRGASRVVAVDIYPPDWFGFASLKAFLGSTVEYMQASTYDLAEALKGAAFDLVLFFGVLYHLRHPLLALDNVWTANTEGGSTFIETAVADHELPRSRRRPLVRFYRRGELKEDGSNWFAPTVVALLDWCGSAGFASDVLHAWPRKRPERCMVRATKNSGREFEQLSYERPLRGVPLVERPPGQLGSPGS